VGIPQYDLYADKPKLSYANWCQKHGLDPARRTILFSTMPQQRHDQQHIILAELLKAILGGTKVPGDLQLIVKCHPFDYFDYEKLLRNYPAAIYRNSVAQGHELEDWLPSQTEMETSRDCLYFCSININIFSTVTIEAAYFDKPIIHIAFDPLPVKINCANTTTGSTSHIVEKKATILCTVTKSLRRFGAISGPAIFSRRKTLVKTSSGGQWVKRETQSSAASRIQERPFDGKQNSKRHPESVMSNFIFLFFYMVVLHVALLLNLVGAVPGGRVFYLVDSATLIPIFLATFYVMRGLQGLQTGVRFTKLDFAVMGYLVISVLSVVLYYQPQYPLL
jgi:hypothetical protein